VYQYTEAFCRLSEAASTCTIIVCALLSTASPWLGSTKPPPQMSEKGRHISLSLLSRSRVLSKYPSGLSRLHVVLMLPEQAACLGPSCHGMSGRPIDLYAAACCTPVLVVTVCKNPCD